MIQLYMPTIPDAPFTCIGDHTQIGPLVEEGYGFMGVDSAFRGYYHHSGKRDALHITMNRLQISRSGATLIIKWSFYPRKAPTAWSGEIKYQLAVPGGYLKTKVLRQRTSASVLKLSDAEREADVALISTSLRLLLSNANLVRCGTLPEIINILFLNPGLEKVLPAAIKASITEHTTRNSRREAKSDTACAVFDALPEGTPLVIRGSQHIETWQLGARYGKTSETIARNAFVPTTEILNGPELRAAGLSAHRTLKLDMLARAALAQCPEAGDFQYKEGAPFNPSKLLAAQPFHPILHKRLFPRSPEVWGQTGDTNPPVAFKHTRGLQKGQPLHSRGQGGATADIPPGPFTLQQTKTALREAKLLPFIRVGNVWCVTQEVAEVLSRFNLGDARFEPIRLLDSEGRLIESHSQYIAWGMPRQTLLTSLCDPNFISGHSSRAIQPYEVTISRDNAEGLDLWWDAQRKYNGTVFMSDALYKALKKAKALPRMALKPCEVR